MLAWYAAKTFTLAETGTENRSCAVQVTSVLHIQTAITQALLAAAQNTLRTKTVHSEVIWALNPSNNVS
jgi:Kinase binding protein CGI-121